MTVGSKGSKLVAFAATSFACLVFSAQTAAAATFIPTRLDDPAPDGCLPTDCSLREAIIASEAAPGGDTVGLSAGTYTLTRPGADNTGLAGDLDITGAVTITGFGPGTTIVDGGDYDRIFDLNSTAFVFIGGLTVRNGSAQAGFFGHSHGGGIHNHGRLILSKVAISGSAVPVGWGGGGLTNAPGATATLENVTVAGNASPLRGGGIENSATLNAGNVTIAGGNSAPAGQGGGLFTAASATSRLNNTIVAGNTGGDCSGTVTSVGHNLAGDASCTGLTGTGDQTSTNPMLIPTADAAGFVYQFDLPAASPAVDTGSGPYNPSTDIGCATEDQRGIARPVDGNGDGTAICDIGAIERFPAADLSLTKVDSPDPVVQGQNLTYTLTVTNNGLDTATAVTVTDALPATVTLVSASPGCVGTTIVICSLGSIASGTSKTVTIVVATTAAGTLTNNASVSSSVLDPALGNNSAVETTVVNGARHDHHHPPRHSPAHAPRAPHS